MKQLLEQEKAWEMIRGAKKAGGQIISATIHVRITEGSSSMDFSDTVKKLFNEGLNQPRGRAVVVWGEQAMDIANTSNIWLKYGVIEGSELLGIARNLARKAGFGESGRLRVTGTIEFPERNRIVTLHDLSYPARGGECVAETRALKPFKAISSSGEFTFATAHELKEFLKRVNDAETHMFDDETGRWVRWVEVEQQQNKLIINIPGQKGRRQLQIDLQSGEVKETK